MDTTSMPLSPQSNEQESVTHSSVPDNEHLSKLVNIPITGQNEALNVLIAFLSIAQKRGVFTLQESAKLWDCVQMFTPSSTSSNDNP